jgi:hypothetical protein
MGGEGSGGWNRKPAAVHRLQNTFRRDRHDRPGGPPALPPEALGPAPRGEPVPVRTHYQHLRAALGAQGTKADATVVLLTAKALAELDEPSSRRSDAWRRALSGLRALRLTPAARGRTPVPESSAFDVGKYSR